MTAQNQTISKPILVVVEGKDDAGVLAKFCKEWGFNDIQFYGVNGKPNNDNVSAVINQSGFADNVRCFAIVRDADDSFDNAKRSVESILSALSLTVKTGFFILPSHRENGMLETLLMRVVAQNNTDKNQCINSFMDCLATKRVTIPDHKKDKAKTYAFLSANDDPGKRINEAAQAGFWDHNNDSLKPLKDFFQGLCTAETRAT